jgi:hypothetical protein
MNGVSLQGLGVRLPTVRRTRSHSKHDICIEIPRRAVLLTAFRGRRVVDVRSRSLQQRPRSATLADPSDYPPKPLGTFRTGPSPLIPSPHPFPHVSDRSGFLPDHCRPQPALFATNPFLAAKGLDKVEKRLTSIENHPDQLEKPLNLPEKHRN